MSASEEPPPLPSPRISGTFHSHFHSAPQARILVLRGGALGDFIVTLPMLAALRQRWPAAHIELAGNATAAQLARARGLLDAVHSQHEARWSTLYGPDPLAPDFAAWLDSFDLIVSYWPDPERDLARRFPRHAQQTFLAAPPMPTRAPAAAHYLDALRPLGIDATDTFFRLRPLSPPASISKNAERPIAIHPGSGSPRKNWPAENWHTLLAQLDAPIALILGEAEQERWTPPFRQARGPEPVAGLPTTSLGSHVRFALSLPLEDLISLLASCRLFLGHDSGISHLAAACGVPCVLLFGPTDPATWAPPAPHVHVLQCRADLRAIAVEDVLSAIRNAPVRS